MDLKTISDSIAALSTTKSLMLQNAELQSKLESLSATFENYKKKAKEKARASRLSYENKLSSLKAQVEELQMVISKQQNDELKTFCSKNNIIEKPASPRKQIIESPRGLLEIVSQPKVWKNLKFFLDAKDLISVLSISEVKKIVIRDPHIFNYLMQVSSITVVEKINDKKLPEYYTQEQKEFNDLVEKYVKQPYVIGRQVDLRLKNTLKTLLNLQKNNDNSKNQPNKYTSAADLILDKFPYDKTIELLAKSTSLFAKSPNSMGEWLNFINSTISGLLFDSAVLYNEGQVIFT